MIESFSDTILFLYSVNNFKLCSVDILWHPNMNVVCFVPMQMRCENKVRSKRNNSKHAVFAYHLPNFYLLMHMLMPTDENFSNCFKETYLYSANSVIVSKTKCMYSFSGKTELLTVTVQLSKYIFWYVNANFALLFF